MDMFRTFLVLSFYICTWTLCYYIQLFPDTLDGRIIGISYTYMSWFQVILYNLAAIGLFLFGYHLAKKGG